MVVVAMGKHAEEMDQMGLQQLQNTEAEKRARGPAEDCLASAPNYLKLCLRLSMGKAEMYWARTDAHVWPRRLVTSRWGDRMSQILMLLSTEPVARTQSLYLHQSVDSTSCWWAAMLRVGWGCRRSHTFSEQSPEQDANTSACAGFLQDDTSFSDSHHPPRHPVLPFDDSA